MTNPKPTSVEQHLREQLSTALDRLRAIEHDLRWENQGMAAALVAAVADQIERDAA
ncbi:hypothetical protein IU443_28595 [Nocardia farcinica]|uniref:hypothetical protein n=1 Tax=Nocardia farcinica TaxID=37329 RepID=UPI0009CB3F9C|nr:hypothetical protein [Nocardia farcinica]MBF6393892.1 hypothetical protein [Nocardia farcinica]SLG33056.1 Uncharacterised protein [Mycobacteroides abscessus subsp. abscessus]